MKLSLKIFLAAMVVAGVAWRAGAAVTNTVPWYDSFEAYTNGTLLVGTNGWTGAQADAGLVTSTQAIVSLLANYTNTPVSGTYPVTGSHTNILALNAEMVNHVQSSTGGVVKVDFMALATWTDTLPQGDTGKQYQVCITTNGGQLSVWQHNQSAGTNEWRTLAASPVISTSEWTRFTIVHDYSNQMFQIAVNQGAPLTDAVVGWTARGGSLGGSWFYMVQTNGSLSQLSADASPAYIDDLVVAKRLLSWSRTNLSESAINNGAIDNSTPLLITVSNETFSGTIGENFIASGKLVISGLASNLVAVAQLTNASQVAITLTNVALTHEAVNSANLTIQFANTAFTMRNAWDVTGSQTNVALVFSNTPTLSYSTNRFYETTTNNGTIDNSSPLLITLANGTFAGTLNEDFATNTSKLIVGGLPGGLTVQALWLNATQLQVKLQGTATHNDSSNNVSNLTLSLQDGAFSIVPASSVFNLSTNFSISFIDPSALTYGTTVFTETVANNGAVGGTTLTLVNKSFNATQGEDMVASGKVNKSNLPLGLGLQVIRGATAQDATVVFTSAASSHAAVNSISNFGITFLDGAFVGANAAGVANYSLSNLQINFADPRSLVYSATNFRELSGGVIDNRHPVTITLAGDALVGANGSDFVAAGKVLVGGPMPSGLSAVITKNSATQLSVSLVGRASPNTAADSVTTVSFTFLNGAFAGGNAVYVTGYANTGISVTFTNDSGFFNVMPYQEPFEEYANGLWLAGTNGWTGSSDNAGIVTNIPALTNSLGVYATVPRTYPISSATHTQVLYVQDTLLTAVNSEASTNVFVDFLAIPVPMIEAPVNDVSQQWAFYVTTNRNLVIWQQTRSGGPSVNTWITLSNAPAISTSQWVRFTIENDYVNDMFRLRVNQGQPIVDSMGLTGPGGSLGGSWFYMVQTNHVLNSFKMSGGGDLFIEDLSIAASLDSEFLSASGSIYIIR